MQTQTHMRPVTPTQVVIEVAAGALAGLACAVLAGLAAARLFGGANEGWGDLIGAVLGALLGYTLGAAAGVYAAGRRLTGRGSIWLSLLGAALGVLVVALVAGPLRLNASPTLLQAAFAVVVPILAALAFNYRRLLGRRP